MKTVEKKRRSIQIFLAALALSFSSFVVMAQSDDLLITTGGVKRQFFYGGAPKRVWESIRNFDIPDKPQLWQFRYDPLFVPETDSDGKLAIRNVKFGIKRRLTLNLFLDNNKAQDLAYLSIKNGFPANAGQIAKDNISAIVLSQLSITIPDLQELGGVRLVNSSYPAIAANESILIVLEVSDDQKAKEVMELLESNTVAIYYDMSFAARQATYNAVKIKFSDLKNSNLFAKLDGLNTNAVYVHRDDMRRLLEKSSGFTKVDGQIENPDQFDRDFLRAAYDKLGAKQNIQLASFDAEKIKSTYNAKDLEPSVLTRTLNKVLQWDEGSKTFKVNTSGETGGGFSLVGIFEANGNLKGNYTKEEVVTFLRKNDIETQIEGNMIVPKAINLQQINMSDFNSENEFSSVTAYVSKIKEVLKGRIDLNTASRQIYPDLATRISELERRELPVGAIIPFFLSPGEIAAMSPKWLPANGQVVSDAQSPLNGRKLPDLLNRTILGAEPVLDTTAENTDTINGTLQFSAGGRTEPTTTINTGFFDVAGPTGTPDGEMFVNDTAVNETRVFRHRHDVPATAVNVEGTLPRQPFRKLVYMILVRR